MDKELLKAELDKLKALQAISHLEGVKYLVDKSRDSIMACVNILSSQYAEKSEQELRSLCATLRANLEIYQLITGANKEVEAIENLFPKESQ